MKTQLFLMCPNAHLEPFIRSKFGAGSNFLTALGTAFRWHDHLYAHVMAGWLEKENIQEIIWVTDTSCQFMNSLLNREKVLDIYAIEVLQDVWLEHFSYIMEGNNVVEQKKRLASLHLQRQAEELLSSPILKEMLDKHQLTQRGLITTRTQNLVEEISLSAIKL